MSFSRSYLSSPTVRIRIPPPSHSEDEEEKFYYVHRSVLKSKTNIIATSNIKPRETLCTLPSTVAPTAFESVLEFLYTGEYALAEEYEVVEDAPEQHPVVAAAMGGAIGVWGKPAAVHDDNSQRNISSYESELVPEWKNEYQTQTQGQQSQTLPSPPPSPTFSDHKPVLSAEKQKLVLKRSTATSRLAAHLEIYSLARRYAVKGLSAVALEHIKTEVVASPDILHELVRIVYGTKNVNQDLRSFLVSIIKDNWQKLQREEVFATLLKEGGQFVVDVFSNVKAF